MTCGSRGILEFEGSVSIVVDHSCFSFLSSMFFNLDRDLRDSMNDLEMLVSFQIS